MPRNFTNLGSTGLKRYGPYIYEEFLSELRWPGAGRVYQEMSDNDPVIGAILYLAEMLIRGTTWSVEPASTEAFDIEAGKFLEGCMNDMEMSWDNTISEILSMITYGFSFHEIVYKVRRGPKESNRKYKSKFSDGKIGWRNLPIRAQTSLHSWEFDKEGYTVAFVQQAPDNFDIIPIPMAKGLLFRTRVSKDNPEGKSLLRNAYRPWFFKKHFEEIEGIGIERDLAGFPVLQAPENMDLWDPSNPEMVSLRAQAEMLVASIRRDSEEGVVLPFGWDLSLLASSSSRQINIGDTIERYDNRIAITLLSDIILLGGKSGSFALADSKQSMLASALQSQLWNIADVFNNKAVPDLFMMNGIELEKYPQVTPGQIQVPSLKEVALMLRAMGLKINKDLPLQNYLRKLLDAPALSKDDWSSFYDTAEQEEQSTDTKDASEKEFEQNDQNYTGGAM